MQEYFGLLIDSIFKWYTSQWVIRNNAQQKIDKNEARTLKMRKKKKLKVEEQPRLARQKTFNYSKWLNPNLELSS